MPETPPPGATQATAPAEAKQPPAPVEAAERNGDKKQTTEHRSARARKPGAQSRSRRGARIVRRFASDEPTGTLPRLPRADLVNVGGITAIALVGLLVLGTGYTLYFARPLLAPMTAAVLLGFLLKPVIRLLRAIGIPEMLGTIVVFLAFIATIGASVYLLATPASKWLAKVPQDIEQAERRLRNVIQSFGEVREAVDDVGNVSSPRSGSSREPDVVRVAPEPLSARILNGFRSFAIGGAAAAFLLFLLLASGETFLRRTVSMLPTLNQKKRLVRITHRIERDLSVYLVTTSIINACLGAAVGFALFLIGVPNPVMWGVVVAVLNFIPYLGGLIGTLMIGLVAIASIDSTGRALLAPAAYLVLNGLEAYMITPHIMGARFSLNPVAVFGAVAFWGWIWGIPGALLAVPILTATSIVCANIDRLRPIAVFLRA
jgi:predicted PurR-regulated permease PerM